MPEPCGSPVVTRTPGHIPDPKRFGRDTFFDPSSSTCRPVNEVENRVSDNLFIIIIKSVVVNAVAFLAIFFYALCIPRVK
ncbi:hypothetical protein Btru_042859 [Bulinus truncatus]|nr:hypothetical protein Btru_042859 [Bulinus truncatus]